MKLLNLIIKIGGIVRNSVRKFDLFSQQIMFTYKGESSFSTFFGGIVSLIIFVVIAVYTGFLMQVMVDRKNANNSLSTEVIDLIHENEVYYTKQTKI